MAKVTVDNFAEAVEDILNEYAEEVNLTQQEVTEKVVKTGVRALKSPTKAKIGGKRYAAGWTQKAEPGRLEYKATLHNKNTPGLTHLMEKSHPVGNGGYYNKPHTYHITMDYADYYFVEALTKLRGQRPLFWQPHK